MELDDLKKAWGKFNDKVNEQALVESQQIEQMLAKKRMTNYKKLLWYEGISLGILFLLLLNLCLSFLVEPFYLTILDVPISIIILTAFGVNLFQYYKLRQAGCMKHDLEHQILYILQYRASLYWGYICVCIAIIPGVVLFIIYADMLWGCIVVGFVALATLLDVFIFGHLFRKIEKMLEANKELKRLEKTMHDH